jgi:hypothetical protein
MYMNVFEHADLPLPQLLRMLNRRESIVGLPYVFLRVDPDQRTAQQSLAEKMRLADLAVEPLWLESPDLVPGTGIWVVVQGRRVSINSGVDQYLPETIAELLELYCRVVESVVDDPEQTLSELINRCTSLHAVG